jgi:hypothetical protein
MHGSLACPAEPARPFDRDVVSPAAALALALAAPTAAALTVARLVQTLSLGRRLIPREPPPAAGTG